jgi:hypothetical protein
MPFTLADVRIFYNNADGSSGVFEYTTGDPTWSVPLPAGEPLELRQARISFGRFISGSRVDDYMTTGIHLLKTPGDPRTWDPADFAAAVAAIDAWWNTLRAQFSPYIRLSEISFYKAGPSFDPPASPGPAVHRVLRDVAGTAAASQQLPDQSAVTITERTMSRKRWGRMYLPPPWNGAFTATTGRLSSAFMTAAMNAHETLYNALLAADLVPCVYSKAQPTRTTKRGHTLPAKPASALKVNTLQIDNVPDVIRSRRLKTVTERVRRGLAVS